MTQKKLNKLSSSIVGIIAASSLSAPVLSAGNSDLVYVPVEPCRIVNTKDDSSVLGPLTHNTNQAFLAWSANAAELVTQGGGDCPQPRVGMKPMAMAANITAVAKPFKSKGNLTAYPNGSTVPTTSLVNFQANNIANSSIISLEPDNLKHFNIAAQIFGTSPSNEGSLEVYTIVDVIGYFYPQKQQSMQHVITVSALHGDYTDPAAAMAAIPGGADAPSAINPYLIKIGPGEYDLAVTRLQMQAYVDIQGAGKNVTIIKGTGFGSSAGDQATVLGSNHATLSNLTVKNTGGANYATAIAALNTDSSFHIDHVAAMAMNASVTATAINNAGASTTINHVMAKAMAGGNKSVGISTTGGSAKPVIMATTASAEGALLNTGMSMDDGAQATVRNSVLQADDAALEVTGSSGTTTINFSTIIGPVENLSAGLSCSFNVNGKQ